jgi:hypothetical protein
LGDNLPRKASLLNRALLWYLQTCLRLADKLGYQIVALHLATAIDALAQEAIPEQKSDQEIAREEHTRLVLEMFEKYENNTRRGDDSQDSE